MTKSLIIYDTVSPLNFRCRPEVWQDSPQIEISSSRNPIQDLSLGTCRMYLEPKIEMNIRLVFERGEH